MKKFWQPLVTITIGASCLLALGLAGCNSANKCNGETTCAPRAAYLAECPRCAVCEHRSSPCSACTASWRSRCERETCSSIYLPTGDRSDAVLKLEKCGPREVRSGEPFKYTIKVTNRTKHALRNVTVIDELPQDVSVQGPIGGGAGWIPHDRPAGAHAANVVRYPIGDLGPRETRCIEQCGVAGGTGCLSSCLTAQYDLYACLQTAVTQPQLALCMTGPQDVFICRSDQDANLHVTVRNTGSATADNVRVTVSIMPPPGAPQLTAAADSERMVGALGCDEERSFDICLPVLAPGEYRVAAQAVGDAGLRTERSELLFFARFAALNIRAAGPDQELIGLPIEYRILIENTGNAPDTNVTVTAELPPGVLFLEATDGGQPAGERVVWNIGNFPPGQPRELGLRVRATDVARTINPVFVVCGDCGGQQSVMLATALEGVPALLLEMIDIQDPLRIGELVEYRVTIINQGSAPETNIRMAARLPDELTFVRSAGPTEPRVEGPELTFATVPLLPPKEKITWTIFAHCDRPGDMRMAVQVQSDQAERPIRETEATRVY
ncbi:MAG: DUF11 domain-containing protein [Phycisphaerae bacterium]|nr:DUF11 domain-containing protein [Phycisphaerae bacterium]